MVRQNSRNNNWLMEIKEKYDAATYKKAYKIVNEGNQNVVGFALVTGLMSYEGWDAITERLLKMGVPAKPNLSADELKDLIALANT